MNARDETDVRELREFIQRGFTAVYLAVVVAFIALAVISLILFVNLFDKISRVEQAITTTTTIQK